MSSTGTTLIFGVTTSRILFFHLSQYNIVIVTLFLLIPIQVNALLFCHCFCFSAKSEHLMSVLCLQEFDCGETKLDVTFRKRVRCTSFNTLSFFAFNYV